MRMPARASRPRGTTRPPTDSGRTRRRLVDQLEDVAPEIAGAGQGGAGRDRQTVADEGRLEVAVDVLRRRARRADDVEGRPAHEVPAGVDDRDGQVEAGDVV